MSFCTRRVTTSTTGTRAGRAQWRPEEGNPLPSTTMASTAWRGPGGEPNGAPGASLPSVVNAASTNRADVQLVVTSLVAAFREERLHASCTRGCSAGPG
jgi:hypothetical protein